MNIGWFHQTYQTGEWDGFNDSGIETFRENPLVHLAREVIQNSMDARLSSKLPVVVSFKVDTVDTQSIPNFSEFSANIKACAYEHNNKVDEKASSFFANALKLVTCKKLTVMRIVDRNTTGIKGPCVQGAPYNTFMKEKGVSNKDSEVASGSYGIGKNAPYASSELRTVFVSTVYASDDGYNQLTQGRTMLTSFDTGDGISSAIGFWGRKQGCLPVESIDRAPAWLQNAQSIEEFASNQGTTLTILGFDAEKHWAAILACAVIQNFFGAIAHGDLVVNVGDKLVLNSSNFNDVFNQLSEFFLKVEDKNEDSFIGNGIDLDAFKNAYLYYQAQTTVTPRETQDSQLGHCKLHLMIGENLPKKVCILRNGMFITDRLKNLIRFSDYKDFVAVFECVNDDGNKLLRTMEPPAHNDFNELLLPKESRRKGKRALNALTNWVRAILKEDARDPVSERTALDELKDLLGDEASGSASVGEEVNPLGQLFYQGKPIKIQTYSAALPTIDGDVGRVAGVGEGGGGNGGNTGAGSGRKGRGGIQKGGIGGGMSMKRGFELANIRAPFSKGDQRNISFTPCESGKISIKIMEAGADFDYAVNVIDSDFGVVRNGGIELDCVANKRITLTIKLADSFKGAIKVIANEI